VGVEDPQGIGPVLPVERNAEDPVFVEQIPGIRGSYHREVNHVWNAVFGNFAPHDLFQSYP
jgi:hypothetical protein